MRKTSKRLESRIVSLIMEGTLYKDIERSTGVAVSTIKKIRKRNDSAFEAAIEAIDKDQLIQEVMAPYRHTMNQLKELLRKDEAGELNVSLSELALISDEMFKRTQSRTGLPPYKAGKTLESCLKKYL